MSADDEMLRLFNHGLALSNCGRHRASIAEFEKVLLDAKLGPKAHHNIAVCYRQLGELARAVEHFQTALALNPKLLSSYLDLGSLLGDLNRVEEAERVYRDGLAIEPRDVRIGHNLGLLYETTGHLDEARDVYRGTLAVHSDYPAVSFKLGRVLEKQSQLEEALGVYQVALTLTPDTLIHTAMVGLLVKLERFEDAARQCRAMLETDTRDPVIRAQVGGVLVDIGLGLRCRDTVIKGMAVVAVACLKRPWRPAVWLIVAETWSTLRRIRRSV